MSSLCSKYNAYLGRVENERLKWHDTKRACLLGDYPQRNGLCGNGSCALYRIIETSFDGSRFGATNPWGRYGRGIYPSAISSKADSYVQNRLHWPFKVMLLNKVVMGHERRLQVNAPNLTQHSHGYHSVVGEPCSNLNYEESVVYDNNVVRPNYIVVYDAMA